MRRKWHCRKARMDDVEHVNGAIDLELIATAPGIALRHCPRRRLGGEDGHPVGSYVAVAAVCGAGFGRFEWEPDGSLHEVRRDRDRVWSRLVRRRAEKLDLRRPRRVGDGGTSGERPLDGSSRRSGGDAGAVVTGHVCRVTVSFIAD